MALHPPSADNTHILTGSSYQVAPTIWLRVAKHSNGHNGEIYTAYSSTDGEHWIRGGTWQHSLGSGAPIQYLR